MAQRRVSHFVMAVELLPFRSVPGRATLSVLIGLIAGSVALAQSSRPGVGSIPYADASGTGVTFRVWSPNASSVAVRGNFNPGGWNNTSNFLVKEVGTEYWSKDVPN